ncbi:putative C6 transcription factor [Penicillium brasilianum]|uniref:Putative C6 transcription factor n=1 Tax=Penicillium brasilianum TaxID=104259 RepID=A0A1S9RJ11_PENBI|nr:putative C6 transcription factor [Penicillium brasilianum]
MSSWPNEPGGNTRSKVAIPRISGRHPLPKRQRVARACDACRQIKLKCNGNRPSCDYCLTIGSPCLYSASKREVRQISVQRLEERIQDYESALGEVLLHCPSKNFRTVLELISERRPEFLAALQQSARLPQSPPDLKINLNLERMHLTYRDNRFGEGLSLQRQPLIQTKSIQHWTSLVEDDVASHLLSFYFNWENPTWHLIDQELFIHDLETRSTKFCSPLLVHILLLFGCSFSYGLHSFTDRRQEKALGQNLYDEILRLWALEKDTADIPTLQSGILLGLLCCTFGTDRLGTELIMRGAAMYYRSGLHEEGAPYFQCANDDLGQNMARAQKLISWGVFDVQSLASQVYKKHSEWPQPPQIGFSLEEATSLDDNNMWTPYPFQTPIFASNTYKIARFRGRLAGLVNETATFSLQLRDSGPSENSWAQGCEIYEKLLQWNQELPLEIQQERKSTPHCLCLRMYYQCTVINICDVFEALSISQPEGRPELDAAGIKSGAVEILGSLILLYKHFHGWKSVPIVMLHYLCVAGIHAIARLSPSEMKWMKVLESSVLGLWNMAIGWGRLGKAFLKILAFLLRARKVGNDYITPKTAAIMDQLDGAYWTATDAASLAADYVVHSVPSDLTSTPSDIGREVTAQSVNELIKAAQQLAL